MTPLRVTVGDVDPRLVIDKMTPCDQRPRRRRRARARVSSLGSGRPRRQVRGQVYSTRPRTTRAPSHRQTTIDTEDPIGEGDGGDRSAVQRPTRGAPGCVTRAWIKARSRVLVIKCRSARTSPRCSPSAAWLCTSLGPGNRSCKPLHALDSRGAVRRAPRCAGRYAGGDR